MNFRKKAELQTQFKFNLDPIPLSWIEHYKYLGVARDDPVSFEEGINFLSDSAGRTLGAVHNKVKSCTILGYETFTQIY